MQTDRIEPGIVPRAVELAEIGLRIRGAALDVFWNEPSIGPGFAELNNVVRQPNRSPPGRNPYGNGTLSPRQSARVLQQPAEPYRIHAINRPVCFPA